MPIIDRKKPEYADVADTLDGEVLMERSYDSKGNLTGWVTIRPEVLKWFALNRTPEELDAMGYGRFMDKVNAVKGMAYVEAKAPPLSQGT